MLLPTGTIHSVQKTNVYKENGKTVFSRRSHSQGAALELEFTGSHSSAEQGQPHCITHPHTEDNALMKGFWFFILKF